jgi:A/G-specific adenine glycosylase
MASPAGKSPIGTRLIRWSRRRNRDLPWGDARDPYRIWISEIMLQQTRVETVIPYYRRFIKRFPTLKDLAHARLQTVLKVWEGLGYYSRARNLLRGAKQLVAGSGNRFPRTAAEWEKLPGIGRYTAAAISSLAFDEPAVALDANARRILARLFVYRRGIRDARAQRDLAGLFQGMRNASAPGAFLQAMMDLGQLVCLPGRPLCAECPISAGCKSKKLHLQERLPVSAKAVRIPHLDVTAAMILRAGKVLLARRPEGKILGGMWEFPGGKRKRGESLPECLRRELMEELGVKVHVREKLLAVEHAFSHFRITLFVFHCDGLRGRPKAIGASDLRWVRVHNLRRYPMGRADRLAAEHLAGQYGGQPLS